MTQYLISFGAHAMGHIPDEDDGPYPGAIGGFTLVDVPSREEALQWAAKLAVARNTAADCGGLGTLLRPA